MSEDANTDLGRVELDEEEVSKKIDMDPLTMGQGERLYWSVVATQLMETGRSCLVRKIVLMKIVLLMILTQRRSR